MRTTINNNIPGKCFVFVLFSIALLNISCEKRDTFLDAMSNSKLTVPTNLNDYQKLLDYTGLNVSPMLNEYSSDDYYIFDKTKWSAVFSAQERNAYIWAPDIFEGTTSKDWNQLYTQVLYANISLEGLGKITVTDQNKAQYDYIKGEALFLRSCAFFNIAQVWAMPYDSLTATKDLGIPLKLTAGVTDLVGRSTIKETYDRIISDLNTAIDLLPANVPFTNLNRGSKPAAYALLARTYLSMRSYNNAGIAARKSLALYKTLMDYNTINAVNTNAITIANVESMYAATLIQNLGLNLQICSATSKTAAIDTTLIKSYDDPNDLRLTIFYKANSTFPTAKYLKNIKNSYGGTTYYGYSGFATDETYLISAESYARAGKITEAMTDLNTLLVTRWKTGKFVPFTAATKEAALALILKERRKELVFRGLRWVDLRRLNKEGNNITVTRNLDGTIYTLAPNSPLYVLPIPPDELVVNPIQQNPR